MKRLYDNMDKILLWSCLILFTLGIIMIISASSPVRFLAEGSSDVFRYAYLQFGFGLFSAFLAYVFIIRRPIRKTFALANLGIWGIVILLGMVAIFGETINNAKSWLDLGITMFQPSELTKPAIILYLAYLANYFKNNELDTAGYIWKFVPIALIIVLIAAQPDFGTAMIITLITFLIFIVMPIPTKEKQKITFIAISAVMAMALIVLILGNNPISGEKANRLNPQNIVNPCKDYYNEGLQVCNSLIAINNSNIWGKGFSNSTQKYLYLPYGYTDFIMAITVEELGLIGFSGIMFLYVLIIFRLLIIAKKSRHTGSAIIGYGVAIYIAIHIIVNLGGIAALIPLTGVPLPFLSYGGSYLMSLIFALALAERVAHDNKLGV